MPRSYVSPVRRDRSARTRLAVIDAAVAVFSERGWVATTMPLVAARAGVAVETVYRAVPGGKAALFAAALRAAVGDGAEGAGVPLEERSGVSDTLARTGPHEAIRRYVAVLPGTWRRLGPLLGTLDTAGGDAGLARLREDLEADRLSGMRRFAEDLAHAGALREGLTTAVAADILWTVCSRANMAALVESRGWSQDAYVAWTARILIAELLRP